MLHEVRGVHTHVDSNSVPIGKQLPRSVDINVLSGSAGSRVEMRMMRS